MRPYCIFVVLLDPAGSSPGFDRELPIMGTPALRVVKSWVPSLCLPLHRFWSHTSLVVDRVYPCHLWICGSRGMPCHPDLWRCYPRAFCLPSQVHFAASVVFSHVTSIVIYCIYYPSTLNLLLCTHISFINQRDLGLWMLLGAMFVSLSPRVEELLQALAISAELDSNSWPGLKNFLSPTVPAASPASQLGSSQEASVLFMALCFYLVQGHRDDNLVFELSTIILVFSFFFGVLSLPAMYLQQRKWQKSELGEPSWLKVSQKSFF